MKRMRLFESSYTPVPMSEEVQEAVHRMVDLLAGVLRRDVKLDYDELYQYGWLIVMEDGWYKNPAITNKGSHAYNTIKNSIENSMRDIGRYERVRQRGKLSTSNAPNNGEAFFIPVEFRTPETPKVKSTTAASKERRRNNQGSDSSYTLSLASYLQRQGGSISDITEVREFIGEVIWKFGDNSPETLMFLGFLNIENQLEAAEDLADKSDFKKALYMDSPKDIASIIFNDLPGNSKYRNCKKRLQDFCTAISS